MRYIIVGNHQVDGADPGDVIVVADEARARRLVRGGHLAPAGYGCDVCGDTFDTSRGLAVHGRVHDDSEDV